MASLKGRRGAAGVDGHDDAPAAGLADRVEDLAVAVGSALTS
jgi:hypothetical protein